ncbi:cytochrome o ubiquinol oxidase subunit IV [Roseovarius albus]|nr:cytochrome o ubiquinol oxidase subunit IV [Roseovarius albus]
MRTILTGFALAVILTVLPFVAVIGQWLPREGTLWLIAITAVVQITVHLYFFLGVEITGKHRERLSSLLFACVLIFIMVGGTLWVMGNLYWRMM